MLLLLLLNGLCNDVFNYYYIILYDIYLLHICYKLLFLGFIIILFILLVLVLSVSVSVLVLLLVLVLVLLLLHILVLLLLLLLLARCFYLNLINELD